MEQETQVQAAQPDAPPETAPCSRLSDHIWRPWYAKLWWASIPVYWIGMALSSRVALLADFYDLALAGYLNVLFFPPTALMVLGLGFAQERIGPFDWSGDYHPYERFGPELGPSGLPFYADPLDPRSGPFWIGHKRH
ncbi:hypothetical protein [Sphingopyxis sp. P1IMeth2]|uniref:hypothetical protein n=1 Tax=Sphingopyxis sp. P1IMeth2 TaxID=1892848 RepID=UPI0021B20118|nr:hypothetical protein [Sphingopyxis sp. P1IMeth2]